MAVGVVCSSTSLRLSAMLSEVSISLRSVMSRLVPLIRTARLSVSRALTRPREMIQRQLPSAARTRCSVMYSSRSPRTVSAERCVASARSSGCTSAVNSSSFIRVSPSCSPNMRDQASDKYTSPDSRLVSHNARREPCKASSRRSLASRNSASAARRSVMSVPMPR